MIADSLGSLRRQPGSHDITDLVLSDDPVNYRVLPVIVGGNQSSSAIVQLQGRISERVRNAILGKLRTNGANNYPLWFAPLNNEAANYHVVACLHKGARRDVSEI